MGSTTSFLCAPFSRTNHSHVCGINGSILFCYAVDNESFPRMWDQPEIILREESRNRIIPTYVGSTLPSSVFHRAPANHSHVCGINRFPFSALAFSFESFPRMWDQHPLPSLTLPYCRIIPTYVGSTDAIDYLENKLPNHSHVCGINATLTHPQAAPDESFPRMWDQHDQVIR